MQQAQNQRSAVGCQDRPGEASGGSETAPAGLFRVAGPGAGCVPAECRCIFIAKTARFQVPSHGKMGEDCAFGFEE